MPENEKGLLLRIFTDEAERLGPMPLYEWIVRRAREEGLAGATVLRGLEGFGAHGSLGLMREPRMAERMPIIIEIIDEEAKIEAFLPIVDGVLNEGLVTTSEVRLRCVRRHENP